MFKNLSLSAKISLGFVILIVISAILGLTSYIGTKHAQTYAEITDTAKGSLEAMNKCAVLRREFQINGFVKNQQNKTSADEWNEASAQFDQKLQTLQANKNLNADNMAIVRETIKNNDQYKVAFNHMADARLQCDQAFADWAKTATGITAKVDEAIGTIIVPARLQAIKANDVNAVAKWADFADGLNAKVISEFLKLRIRATYVVATKSDDSWNNYQTSLASVKSGVESWSKMVAGNPALEDAAKQLAQYAENYGQDGLIYYKGMLAQRETTEQIRQIVTNITTSMTNLMANIEKDQNALRAKTNIILSGVTLASIIIGVLLSIVITRSIVLPINRIIAGLTDGSEQVASASNQVSAASQSLAEGATEQAAGLEETSSSLEEMSAMTRQNAENAQQAATLAGESKIAAQEGSQAMTRMNGAINQIQKSSDETAKIIKVIDEIAFQTNLLALNAAVEAARAGEAGKGFAVVAEEVRNLAMRSAEAAKNTSAMIEDSVKNSKNGVDITNEVAKVLNEIVGSVSKTTDLITEIAASSQEQAKGIDQVNNAVAQMDKVTQSNAANAEESASASEELGAQAATMNDIVTELVTLVGGAGARREKFAGSANHAAAKKNLSLSDHTFHHISQGKSEQKPAPGKKVRAATAEKMIPLHDTEMNQFNN